MAELFIPLIGMQVQDVNGVLFLFQFFLEVDVHRVLDMCLWSFDNQLLLIDRLGDYESPLEVPLFYFPMWIQVKGLRTGF